MTPERWHQITEIFHTSLERPDAERDAFLAEACRGDASLRVDVDALLSGHRAGASGAMVIDVPLPAGTRFGSCRIERLVGEGGMGQVYLARDTDLGRDVAIKVLPSDFLDDKAFLERFEREARALAALNHPNIATIYGIERAEGRRGLVLEFVDGPTLADILDDRRLSLEESLRIARQLADALDAAHERGVVHRDIKPANLKITKDGILKVLDFGLAKLTVPSAGDGGTPPSRLSMNATQPGLVVGTAAYMSPEQARGQAVDKRTDIWAFGCVLFEMLTGTAPFDGATVTDILAAIIEREPDWSALPTSVPPGISRLLRQCLVKDARTRLRDIGDARLQIDDLSASPASAAISAPRRYSRLTTWLVGIAVVTASASLATILTRHPSSPPPVYRQITFRRGTVLTAEFAPDGQTIIFSARWEGQPTQLFSTRIDTPESLRLPFDGYNPLSISRSGRVAIRSGEFRIGPGQLAEVSLGGQVPRALLDDVLGADWDPAGEKLAVTRVVNGRTRLEYPVGTVLYDSARPIGYPKFSPKGNSIAFIERGGGGSQPGGLARVSVVDLAGNVTVLSDGWSEAFTLAWRPDGEEIWFSARRAEDPPGGPAIHAVTLTGRHRVVLRAPGVLLIRQIWHDGRVLLNREEWPLTMMCRSRDDAAERDVSWLDFSAARAMSADGRAVLFDDEGVGEGSKGGVYLRSFDGSPAVRLADGRAFALSPDGALAVTQKRDSPGHLEIVPTGAGEARTLDGAGVTYLDAMWFPDRTRLLVTAQEPGRFPALFEQDSNGGALQKIVDGVEHGAVSPDGRLVASINSAGALVFTPLGGGLGRTVGGMPLGTSVLRWSNMDRQLFVKTNGAVPTRIFRVNAETGRAEPWRTLTPADLSGFNRIYSVALSSDGQSYCYSYLRQLSTLFVIEGLT
jgi:serine/threonine protein kinase